MAPAPSLRCGGSPAVACPVSRGWRSTCPPQRVQNISAIRSDVSAGTVNRAIPVLKETGLVDTRRGKRAVVSTKP